MIFEFAPMEGATTYTYRQIHQNFFPGIDRYYSPFVTPNHAHHFTQKEFRDVLPEHNEGIPLIPQLLTNNASDFIWGAGELKRMGYDEVNLNLGCPSGTVVAKHRGAGFLENPDALDCFVRDVFAALPDIRVSVKTRVGLASEEEWDLLLEVYRRWPISRLIIHPRIRSDFYKGTPRKETFKQAVDGSPFAISYNGDIFRVADFEALTTEFPDLEAVMCGRGLLANPALVRQLRGGAPLDKRELQEFMDTLLSKNCELISGDRNIIFRMLDIWRNMDGIFTNDEKYLKKIRKSRVLSDYRAAVSALLREQEIAENCGFRPMR